MVKHFFLSVLLALVAFGHAQDQSGFISIDCGLPDNSSYADKITGINYVSDAEYIDTGVSKSISPVYQSSDLEQQYLNLRTFPEGIKNCYTLTPPFVNGTKYMVRANFMYGNYDKKLEYPTFDLYLGVNYWDTVVIDTGGEHVTKEILHIPSSNYTDVCLVNTGSGTPFISVLELRLVPDNIYVPPRGSLLLDGSYDIRAYADRDIIRFGNDTFDRIWEPSFFQNSVTELNTSLSINKNIYDLPYAVMNTAITMQNSSNNLNFYWKSDPGTQYFLYFHFADFQNTQFREFNIYLNGEPWYGPFKPNYLSTTTIHSVISETPSTWFNFSLRKTFNSTLPPILNAFESYYLQELTNPQTYQLDVDSMKSIKATYGVKKNWQGDPCSPQAFSWEGLNCFNDSFDPPRIISLNLSFSELKGVISPSIFNLTMLKYLDLSNNSLTGGVPDFLSQMTNLTVLKLTGNNLTGSIPSELMKRSENGSLTLNVEGNPNLCKNDSCESTPEKKEEEKNKKSSNVIVPIVASVAALLVLLIVLAILWIFVIKRRKPQQQPQPQPQQVASLPEATTVTNVTRGVPIKSRQQQFTYSELVEITANFQRVLGKGGFGSVYHGYLGESQVAVKMLSPSSSQGYKQFKAEVELLMRVHHANLTSLVGYCDEGNKMGLIYEYMANGDLETHLSNKNHKFLSWDLRLEIAVEAAQGLEYLHTGCRPPIIHRDVKSTNILLNEDYHGKLSDFGLSKVFPTDQNHTHLSTTFAGTPGYFDPEFKLNEKSDVFSFGVVLLEIITGQPPITRVQEKTHISQWVSHMLQTKGDVRSVVDPRLGRDFDLNSAWKVVDVAMECVSATSENRPTMNHVVIELKRCLAMEKARTRKDYETGSNFDSIEMSMLNINTTGMSPLAR